GEKPGSFRWFLVFWLFILSAVAFLDRVNISVAGASIASAYHLTNVQLGTVFSALLWGYALFQTLGGRLADRFGPRRVLTMGVIWWGVFTAMTAAVPANISRALILFIAIRFLLGAGEAVVYPASNQFVARWIPSQERGIANGWIFAGVGAGAGLSPPLITFLMLHYGWRTSFWVCAVLGLIVGAVWYLTARDSPAEHPSVSREELAFIRSGLTAKTSLEDHPKLVPWKNVLTSKDVLAGGAGALYLAQSSFWSVTADIAGRSAGSVSGFMNMGAQIGGAVTAQLTPWIAVKFGWTASFLVAAALCVIGSAAWLIVDPHRNLVTTEDNSVASEFNHEGHEG